ncbi:SH3 and multiple ankyrin repeat domains 3-like isoform X3, partial [Brachionus plicatilis]
MAQITNENLNLADNTMQSKSASLSSSCSSSSYSIKTLNHQDADSHTDHIFVRVSINDQNLQVTSQTKKKPRSFKKNLAQKVMKFALDDLVWAAKQRVLSTLAKEVKDGLNYGFYLPPHQGRAGKFLDDWRKLREYSLSGPVAHLEFKYKKRVYKFVKINQKELKALNAKANCKKFADLVRANQTDKVARLLDKGLDPNFHTDLGETPLSVAVGLGEPKATIMALYNGGAHLDFRSRDSLTPMHRAALVGNDKAVKTLLDLGAYADVADHRALTPLFHAVLNASPVATIEHLLAAGANPTVKDDNNWQQVHHACKLGLADHLDHLVYYGCDLNAANNSGNTPLHLCAVHNQQSCARVLLVRGCAKHQTNLANQSAYECAVMAGNDQVAEIIREHTDAQTVTMKERPVCPNKRRSVYMSVEREWASCSSGSRSRSISSEAGSHKRLYSCIPNRLFVCIKPCRAVNVGEIDLCVGDRVEVVSVGDSGYWEGRRVSSGVQGWFKAECVQEVEASGRKSWLDALMSSWARVVVLQKGKKGFGFVLRGAKVTDEKFEPSVECPAMQF